MRHPFDGLVTPPAKPGRRSWLAATLALFGGLFTTRLFAAAPPAREADDKDPEPKPRLKLTQGRGEEGKLTEKLNEQGQGVRTLALREQGAMTRALNENGGGGGLRATTLALNEEGG